MKMLHDPLGEIGVPETALWGAQTQRAVQNCQISDLRFGRDFILALGHVKRACARANLALGLLDAARAEAIFGACDEIIAGAWDNQFPVDVFQTGSATSTNMNANEVIATRAVQLLGGGIHVHPNDHVNMSQSSNDVIPTTIHVAVTLGLRDALLPALEGLYLALETQAKAFDAIVKTGRTHLQDATPIRMGQVFAGFASQVDHSMIRLRRAIVALRELALGGTAVGTGVNCAPGFPQIAIDELNAALATDFAEAANHVEANAARDALVEVSGALKTVAVSLHKIANDIRWMASGPRNGLGELRLPALQPGSSIMPGKVNPVLPEALIMVCAEVIGLDAANALAGLGGYFELNLMMPLLAHNLLFSIRVLSASVRLFTSGCVQGLEADAEACGAALERNLALATALAPILGYDRAAEIAKEAQRTGMTVREVAQAWAVLPDDQLECLLNPRRMTEPGSGDGA